MKTLKKLILSISTLFVAAAILCSAAPSNTKEGTLSGSFDQTKAPRIAVVNFKTCVEKSKIGQKEQANFDAMKKQMEQILEEKEKALTDVSGKFNDIDYLDSLSADAEADLKRQFRTLNQEFTQQQNQFYQTLSQTNMAIIQKLNEAVTKASADVAKKMNIDLVLNEDGCFFCAPAFDVSSQVVVALDELFEKESKDAKPGVSSLDLKK